jgi:hypothetical protein
MRKWKRDVLFALLVAVAYNALVILTFMGKTSLPKVVEDVFLASCFPALWVIGHFPVPDLRLMIALVAFTNLLLHGGGVFLLIRAARTLFSAREV